MIIKNFFEGKDLFIETKYKFFFNIIFPYSWSESWIFGKPFLRKFPTMIDLTEKIIEIYNNKEETPNKNNGNEPMKNKNEKNVLSTKFIVLMNLIILGLICIFSVLFYFIGKNLNKLRKRKANELNDEYDYTPVEENKTINNIVEE